MNVRRMTHNDVNEVTDAHLRAFKGYLNASIGRSYVCEFLRWFINSPIGISLVLESEGKLIGYVVGAKLGYNKELNKALLKTGIISIVAHPGVLFHRHFIGNVRNRLKSLFSKGTKFESANIEPAGSGVSLVGIAIDPQCSKKGGGSLLIKAFEKESIQARYNYMKLSVYEINQSALNLYTRNGWQLLSNESPVLYYYKVIG
jgi:ribosomal protein S18 acetylase RimI-like enzyme